MAASKELITKIVLRAQADGSVAKAFSALAKNSDTCIGKLAKIGDKAKTAFKVVGSAAIASAGAVIGIGKAAIDSYAEYEQLVGGVETLFKDSSGKLIQYANEAYKTAGLSSNEYMSTITSFSAAMINSLGGDTAKATEFSNRAVIDMSDNANKMGTDMESIMNTYQSLSRGQFGMLDNLKLGYGGTKKEAERLLADAQKITGVKYDLSKFSDVTEAIHVIQEKMGITGTTAKEASTTITGSLNALKSSWKNLLTGMADPSQDLGDLIQKVFDSGMTFLEDNLMPRIQAVMPRISDAITKFSPLIGDAIQTLIPPLIPVVVEGASALLSAVVSNLPTIFSSLMGALPDHIAGMVGTLVTAFAGFKIAGFINTIAGAVKELKSLAEALKLTEQINKFTGALKKTTVVQNCISGFNKFKSALSGFSATQALATAKQWLFNTSLYGCPIVWIIAAIIGLIAIIVLLVKNWDKVKEACVKCWDGIKNAVSVVGAWLKNFFTVTLPNALKVVIDWFKQLPAKIGAFLSGAWQKISAWGSNLWAKAKEIGSNFINGIVNFFKQLPYKIGYCIGFVIGKIILFGQKLWSFATTTVPQFIGKVVDWFKALPGKIWTWLVNVVTKIGQWAVNMYNKMKTAVSNAITATVNFFKTLPSRIWTWLVNTVTKIAQWAVNMQTKMRTAALNAINAVINWFKQLPSRLWTWLLNTISKVASWGTQMVAKAKQAASQVVTNVVNTIKQLPQKMLSLGKNIVQGLWNGIKNAKDWLIGKIKSFASGITDGIKAALGINSPSKVMAKLAQWIPKGMGVGIIKNAKYAVNAVKSMGGKITSAASRISPTISASTNLPKHGTGGTFSTPHAAIVGDRPETIVPHGNTPRNRALLSEAAKGVGANGGGNIFNFTFAPVVNGGNAEENRAMLHDEEEAFERRMEAWLMKNRRLAY